MVKIINAPIDLNFAGKMVHITDIQDIATYKYSRSMEPELREYRDGRVKRIAIKTNGKIT